MARIRDSRDELGSSMEVVIYGGAYLALVTIVAAAAKGIHNAHDPRHPWPAWDVLLVAALVAVGVAGLICLVLWVRVLWRNHREAQVRWLMGSRIAEWLDEPEDEITGWDIDAWLRAYRSGLSVAEARRWSNLGIPFATAAAAKRAGLTPVEVHDLFRALLDGGLVDGGARRDYDRCLAGPMEARASHRVLRRWANFTPEEITEAVRRRLRMPDVDAKIRRDAGWYDASYPGPGYRRSKYAGEILTALEHPQKWNRIQQDALATVDQINSYLSR